MRSTHWVGDGSLREGLGVGGWTLITLVQVHENDDVVIEYTESII